MENKAQVSQVFIYLAAIIVAGAIILIGYTSISSILDRGCEVEEQRFINDIESFLDRNTRLGNMELFRQSSPCSYDELCFAPGIGYTAQAQDLINDNVPSVIVVAANNTDEPNIILGEGNFYQGVSTFDGMSIEDDEPFICFNSTGSNNFEFNVRGLGRNRIQILK